MMRVMRVALALSLAAIIDVLSLGQAAPDPTERGTLRLHYVQKPIGYERYEISPDGAVVTSPVDGRHAQSVKLTADFDFTDRGGRVQLAATLRTKADFTPLSFEAKGKSYRFVNVDSNVRVEGSDAVVRAYDAPESRVTLPAQVFTVDGHAPFSAQMLLLRYWKQHGQPRLLRTVPGQPTNDVIVEARGRQSIRIGAHIVPLEPFAIDGVVWGRETLWLDDRGSLAAATTPAGGLGFEAVRGDPEPAPAQ